ncbi:MAG TPA: non-canonical purine NTP pyrophosphatase [Anaeromyxobacter sp.]
MDLLFGTTNPGKLRELRRLVAGLPVRVVSPEELPRPLPEVVEDGLTFAENAEKKASAFARASGLHALADDSGLCVDALGGAPGVRSARWSEEEPEGLASPACALGEIGAAELGPVARRAEIDERNNDKLLLRLADVPDARRGAEYRAVLALARPDGTIAASVTGVCRGRLGRARRGMGGFGYDPLVLPDAYPERTMAELGADEKDAISHRGDAFRKLRPALEALARGLDENPPKR